MDLFVLWFADGWWCAVNLGCIDCDYNMDDGCFQTNQSGGVLSGVAIFVVVVLCAVFEWCYINVKLKNPPKRGLFFISLKFLSLDRQCSGILAPVLQYNRRCIPEVIQYVYLGRLILPVRISVVRVRDLVEMCLL